MGHGDRAGVFLPFLGKLGKTIHQGGKIRAGIAKEILDASIPQQLQITLGGIFNGYGFPHDLSSLVLVLMTWILYLLSTCN